MFTEKHLYKEAAHAATIAQKITHNEKGNEQWSFVWMNESAVI